jgi:formylmethanofuran dehydrogenase subunit E
VRQVETGRWRQVPTPSGAPASSHGFSTLILPGCGKEVAAMIRKLKSGEYRLYSRKKDPDTGKRRNLGTFKTREAAEKHEREVQYFKRH